MKRIVLVVMMCCLLTAFCACQDLLAAGVETPTPTAARTPDPTPSPTPIPTTLAEETPTPTPAPTRITVMAVGDLMCLGAQLSAAYSGGEYSFDYAFAEVKDTLSSADLTIGNLETLIAEGHPYTSISSGDDDEEPSASPETSESTEPSETTGGSDDGGEVGFIPGDTFADIGWQSTQTTQRQPLLASPRINGPETYLSAVVGAGFDVLTTANNHINDYGTDGIQKTMDQLDAYGMQHTGAYASEEDKVPLIVDVQGIKIGIIAYTDFVNRSGNSDLIDTYNADAVAADIAAAKEAGADFTIVYMHWGTENTHTVTRRQRSIAQHLADSGADLILGAHPHCTQEFELLETESGTVPVIYSLGNFVSSMAGRTINRDGVILKFVLEKDNVTGETTLGPLSYIPTYCTKTSGGSFAVLPADEASIVDSPYASALQKSRERTIDVLGTEIATPE